MGELLLGQPKGGHGSLIEVPTYALSYVMYLVGAIISRLLLSRGWPLNGGSTVFFI